MKSVNKNIKKRNWAFVVYPESLPDNWIEILQLSGLEVAISPLHDKDKDPDGVEKKPHYHVIAVYNGPTSLNVVRSLSVDKLNGVNPTPLESVKGYYRYFTHEDNPDKFQYDKKEIQLLNGFDILSYSDLTTSEKEKIKKELTNLIRTKEILEYREFIDVVIDKYDDDYFRIASSNTIFFSSYIKSSRCSTQDISRHSKESSTIIIQQRIDGSTGEILSEEKLNQD